MKRLLTVFLVLLLVNISECEISKKTKLIAKYLNKIKKLHEAKKARRLQTDGEVSEETFNPPINNKRAGIQFLDVNGYQAGPVKNNIQEINFQIFFYFLNMLVPKKVFVPLNFNSDRLRNLADGVVQAECTPIGTATEEDAVGGKSQKFECGSNITTSKPISGISISSDGDVVTQDESGKNSTAKNDDISFTEDAKSAGSNLEKANNIVDKTLILQNGVLGTPSTPSSYKFTINGDLVEIEDGKTINLRLHDTNTDSDKEIPCVVKREGNEDAVELNCDTNGEYIESDLFFKSGMEGTTKVFLNMTDEKSHISIANGTITEPIGHSYYRKSSSGLSGGAIAGIVIACVAVLGATVLAIFFLRRKILPNQPPINYVNNSTEVNIKAGNT